MLYIYIYIYTISIIILSKKYIFFKNILGNLIHYILILYKEKTDNYLS